MTALTVIGKPKRSFESIQVERRYRNQITLFLAGQMPNFSHQRHLHVANILRHVSYGRELMHPDLQTMTYLQFMVGMYSAELTDRYRDQLDGALPDSSEFADLSGGASDEDGTQ